MFSSYSMAALFRLVTPGKVQLAATSSRQEMEVIAQSDQHGYLWYA
jgi:hypothetical protein